MLVGSFKVSININGGKELICITSDFNVDASTVFLMSMLDFWLRYIFSSVESAAASSYFYLKKSRMDFELSK